MSEPSRAAISIAAAATLIAPLAGAGVIFTSDETGTSTRVDENRHIDTGVASDGPLLDNRLVFESPNAVRFEGDAEAVLTADVIGYELRYGASGIGTETVRDATVTLDWDFDVEVTGSPVFDVVVVMVLQDLDDVDGDNDVKIRETYPGVDAGGSFAGRFSETAYDGGTAFFGVNIDFVSGSSGDAVRIVLPDDPARGVTLSGGVAVPTIENITRSTLHDTIQEAVNEATSGDAIEIEIGVHSERNVVIQDKALTIFGQGAGLTTVSGGGLPGRMFSLRGGADATISDMKLADGVYNDNGGMGGGGVRLGTDAAAMIRRCVFENNSAGDLSGGAINHRSSGQLRVIDSVFRENTAGYGSSIASVSGGSLQILGCLFANDGAGDSVVAFYSEQEASVVNCTFVGGQGEKYIDGFTSAVVSNCAFDDSADAFASPSDVITRTRCLYPGATGNNIDGVPTFLDAADGDYRLAPLSLGIDSADADAYNALGEPGQPDLGNSHRFVDDPRIANFGLGSSRVLDIGAYERQTPACYIVRQPVSVLAVPGGGPYALTVEARYAEDYFWIRADQTAIPDNGTVGDVTTPALIINDPVAAAGLYRCVVASAGGYVLSEPAAVVIPAGGCLADLNGDGFLDLSDVNLFVAGFLGGCP